MACKTPRQYPGLADGGPLEKASLMRLHRDVDWIGAVLINDCLALLSFELAPLDRCAHRRSHEWHRPALLSNAVAEIPTVSQLCPKHAAQLEAQSKANRLATTHGCEGNTAATRAAISREDVKP
ncbi:hypothetical protein BDV38DRAFT_282997 [Aspergillus pseudotamarii]|uniref:Uncharacterized protein n=1 Tax=Aspergillus pseudotamarii TaxID=132259 RepID=A0A5N6SUN1_ASPPS|nr:uncharacterized protein BDV38DRAFT_282997 [Aspergillus pseudotamarii]KAE8137450.1 hypothetical protein BDV38DRAFT_282997 [Aspergillus pseudotamarii]